MASQLVSPLVSSVPMYAQETTATESKVTISKACRVELTNESTRRWGGMYLPDALPAIMTELENSERLGDTSFTTQALDLAIKTITAQIQSQAQPLTPQDQPQLVTVLDQIVTLAKPLPSGYSLGKTYVLTEAAIAYGKLGQSSKGQETLRLASEAVKGIRDVPPDLVAAYIRLAEGWISLDQPTVATFALDEGLAQTINQLTDVYTRTQLLSRIVDLYVQINQPTKALEVLKYLTPQDYDPYVTVTRIAAAYMQTNNPAKAKQLLDPLFESAIALKDVDERETKLMDLVLHYAPSGDLGRSQQIVAQMQRANAFRARSWLTIAAEARKFNQPEIREQAIARLVADAQAANMADQLGGRFDNEWYGEMSNLSTIRGYQPELKALILELRAVNLFGVVLQDLIDNQEFAKARQTVPRPMLVQIDAGYFDESDRWLDNIALAALEAGQIEEAKTRIAEETTDIGRLLRFAQAFDRRGEQTIADQLFTRSQTIAESISALPTAIMNYGAIANALISSNRPADDVLNRIVLLIRTEKGLPQQAQLLFAINSEFATTRATYFSLAEKLRLHQQVDFATLAGEQAIARHQPEEAARFIGYAGRTAPEKLDFTLRVVELHLNQGNVTKGRSLLDFPMQTFLKGSDSAFPSLAERTRFLERIALNLVRAGDTQTAIAFVQNDGRSAENDQLLQRLHCYQNDSHPQ
jgi:hypothetical protein